MIAYIKGTLEEKGIDSIVVEADGVGYEILTGSYVIQELPPLHDEVKIITYMDVKEDSMRLFGFLSSQEKTLFKQLLSVSGVGPKGALSILNELGPDNLVAAIIAGDSKAISKANGIGAKTAQKVVLELRDSVSLEDSIFDTDSSVSRSTFRSEGAVMEAVEALGALGYSSSEAMKTVRSIEGAEDMKVEDIIKAALKRM
ncbi:MAG TPA: Holliday junction branch migration protein RuvA [Lachnospiraceae bacterium]|nr:Holliday junction branch migration protein RuvA [Lachnospiraceae bacterium]